MKFQSYGFVEPIITPDNYILGSIERPIINPFGRWTDYLPSNEIQNKNHETYNCTGFGTCNALEILYHKLFNKEINFSDRFLGIESGTYSPGNDPHKVAETARKIGLIIEDRLPFDTQTLDDYFSYPSNSIEAQCLAEARKWKRQYELGHEWVWESPHIPIEEKQQRILKALRYSPLGISVSAWHKNGELYSKAKNEPDNHWTVLFDYEENKLWRVFDSYDDTTKELEWDYNFLFAKTYSLHKRIKSLPEENWLILFLKSLFNVK